MSTSSARTLYLLKALLITFVALLAVGSFFIFAETKTSKLSNAVNNDVLQAKASLELGSEVKLVLKPSLLFSNKTVLTMTEGSSKYPSKLVEQISIKPNYNFKSNVKTSIKKLEINYIILASVGDYWLKIAQGTINDPKNISNITIDFNKIEKIVEEASKQAGLPEPRELRVTVKFDSVAIITLNDRSFLLKPESYVELNKDSTYISVKIVKDSKNVTLKITNTTITKENTHSWWLIPKSLSMSLLAIGILGLPVTSIYYASATREVLPKDRTIERSFIDERIPRIYINDLDKIRSLAEKYDKPILIVVKDKNREACVINDNVAYCSKIE